MLDLAELREAKERERKWRMPLVGLCLFMAVVFWQVLGSLGWLPRFLMHKAFLCVPLALMFGLLLAWSLRTGQAPGRFGVADRRYSPGLYWFVVTIYAGATGALLFMAVR